MRIEWQFDESAVATIKEFVSQMEANPFVQERRERNLGRDKPETDLPEFWRMMACCLLTTQQRSGPDSAVAKFTTTVPFPLSYDIACSQNDPESFFEETMANTQGIRRTKLIPKELTKNFELLQSGLWADLQAKLDALRSVESKQDERAAAKLIAGKLHGFGPKQSRNLLQGLGLTRYEIPIDSRIVKWLRKNRFPVPLGAKALNDTGYYEFVMDGIAQLCERCEIFPCMLDAAVFASYDGDKWTEETARAAVW